MSSEKRVPWNLPLFITNVKSERNLHYLFLSFKLWNISCCADIILESKKEFGGYQLTREDTIAARAVRLSTLKSIKAKKKLRIQQIKDDAQQKIREINIQYAEDPERLKAKYAAEDYAKSEKARKKAEKAIAKEKAHVESQFSLRPYTLGEEIFSSIVQGIGACLFIAATVLLDVFAIKNVPDSEKNIYAVLFSCFGGIMTLNYVMSILYHAITNINAKEVFKRLSRVGVFLVIVGAYFVYCFNTKSNLFGWIVAGIITVICLTGLIMYAIAGSRLELVNIIFYAVSGLAALLLINHFSRFLSHKSFVLLLCSGAFYVVGLIFCNMRKVKYMHCIGDIVVLLGSASLFFSYFFMNNVN